MIPSITSAFVLPWIFLVAAFVFAFMALDAWRLSVPWREVPAAILFAKGEAQDLSHLPLSEQSNVKDNYPHYGMGDSRGAVWLWGILAGGSLVAAAWGFMR